MQLFTQCFKYSWDDKFYEGKEWNLTHERKLASESAKFLNYCRVLFEKKNLPVAEIKTLVSQKQFDLTDDQQDSLMKTINTIMMQDDPEHLKDPLP